MSEPITLESDELETIARLAVKQRAGGFTTESDAVFALVLVERLAVELRKRCRESPRGDETTVESALDMDDAMMLVGRHAPPTTKTSRLADAERLLRHTVEHLRRTRRADVMCEPCWCVLMPQPNEVHSELCRDRRALCRDVKAFLAARPATEACENNSPERAIAAGRQSVSAEWTREIESLRDQIAKMHLAWQVDLENLAQCRSILEQTGAIEVPPHNPPMSKL